MTTRRRFSLALALFLSLFLPHPAGHAAEEAESIRSWRRFAPEKPQDLEGGAFLLELTPYFQTGRGGSSDQAGLSLLFRADIGPDWEFRASGDAVYYQNPDIGFDDPSLGVKWKPLAGDFSLALALDVEFPIGMKEFREPGVEPTLSLLMSRKIGPFEPSFSISLTYVSAERGKPYYLSPQVSAGIDYTPDDRNSYGVFATGYTPVSNDDHSSRVWIGGTYTRTLTPRHSVSVSPMKGLSRTGMDWYFGLTWDSTF